MLNEERCNDGSRLGTTGENLVQPNIQGYTHGKMSIRELLSDPLLERETEWFFSTALLHIKETC